MTWYYARRGQRFGPVEQSELQRLAGTGQFGPGDLAWRPGLPEWRPAGELPELAYLFRPASNPVPVVAPPPPAPPYGTVPSPTPGYAIPLPPPGAPAATEYASFGARFAALLIDYLIVLALALGVGVVFGIVIASGGGEMTGDEPIWNLLGAVLAWTYFAGLESSVRMATFGKRFLGLRVTDLHGQRITFGRATGRYFGKFLSALPFALGFFLMISDPRKQTWHDKMAGCLVLRQR